VGAVKLAMLALVLALAACSVVLVVDREIAVEKMEKKK
jgi:hypothetical protein